MRLVVPGMPIGTPAIMTIFSPLEAIPNSFGILFDLSIISSVSFHSGIRKGWTPQQRLSLFTVERCWLKAKMGWQAEA
jgi:hypothetical protein